jgi:hypothetical protein
MQGVGILDMEKLYANLEILFIKLKFTFLTVQLLF